MICPRVVSQGGGRVPQLGREGGESTRSAISYVVTLVVVALASCAWGVESSTNLRSSSRYHGGCLALARPCPFSASPHSAMPGWGGCTTKMIGKKDASRAQRLKTVMTTTVTTTPGSTTKTEVSTFSSLSSSSSSSSSTFSPAASFASIAAAAAAVVCGSLTRSPLQQQQQEKGLRRDSSHKRHYDVSSSPYVSVDIRKPVLSELVSVVDLRLEVFCGPTSVHNPEVRERSLRQLVNRQRKGSVCLVATARDVLSPTKEDGEAVVGTVEFSTHEFHETSLSPSCDTGVPKLYVTEMAVSESFRRRGVASGLLKAVDEHAKSMGIPFVCLFVETKNRSAIELYLKAGYHVVPYSPQAVAFASAIGLYSGALANREYYFCYKRLPVSATAAAQQQLQPQAPAPMVARSVWGSPGADGAGLLGRLAV